MLRFFRLWLEALILTFRSRQALLLENLALRQQLAVLKRRHPRPQLDVLDKLFWVAARRFWSGWKKSLILVTPETVIPLAPKRLSVVLEGDLQGAEARRQKEDF